MKELLIWITLNCLGTDGPITETERRDSCRRAFKNCKQFSYSEKCMEYERQSYYKGIATGAFSSRYKKQKKSTKTK